MESSSSSATMIPAEGKAAPLVLRTRPAIDLNDDQFAAFCQQNRELQIEQSAQGDWVIMAPTGGETGYRNVKIIRYLDVWADQDGTGIAFDSSTGFTLPNGARRSPDASWVLRSRLAALTPEQKQRFLPLCPDFVVELRSPSDNLGAIQAKMDEYLANGARLGWLIDAAERRVHVYRPEWDPEILEAPARLSGDPALPGFVLDLPPIWQPDF